jgi:hypothetical protein
MSVSRVEEGEEHTECEDEVPGSKPKEEMVKLRGKEVESPSVSGLYLAEAVMSSASEDLKRGSLGEGV